MESNRVEYKRELTDGFEREAIAFLNYRDGGVIYIGIERDGAVVGVSGCFVRIGSASEPMSGRMIEELFAKRTRNSLGRMRSLQQSLNFEQLRIYYDESGFSLGDRFAANLELLTEDGAYNYAAYLLSDRNGNSVHLAQDADNKAGMSRMLGHKTISGELNKQLKRLLSLNLIEMTIPDKPNSRLQKYRLTERGKAWLNAEG
jgi:Putative DNA-binding domain